MYRVSEGYLRRLLDAYLHMQALEADEIFSWEQHEAQMTKYLKTLTEKLVDDKIITLREQQHLTNSEAQWLIINQILSEARKNGG